jgi:hypothetical protein
VAGAIMAIEHTCGTVAYSLSYQKKALSENPKYFKTNRYYCEKCYVVLKVVEEA